MENNITCAMNCTINTEYLQHHVPQEHGLFQVYTCKYPA